VAEFCGIEALISFHLGLPLLFDAAMEIVCPVENCNV
jgi:hypothetical protein